MKQFISFSKIGQFKGVVKDVRSIAKWNSITEPTISFHGTVKSHGTNAGVVFAPDGTHHVQSRKNIITPTKDNAGFACFAEKNIETFERFNTEIRLANPELVDETLAFFGEWAGQGIQKGVALSKLPKFFKLFAVKVKAHEENLDGSEAGRYLPRADWETLNNDAERIFNVNDFPSFDIEIDFTKPALYVNDMTALVEAVEAQCPIGKALGADGVGEGLVWVGWHNGQRLVFKTKGEKHSASKVKVLIPVDIEKVKGIQEFVETNVTENRLNQAIEQVFTSTATEPSKAGTGTFLKWMVNDIHAEEMDTIIASGLEPKDVNGPISKLAREWFFKFLDKDLGM